MQDGCGIAFLCMERNLDIMQLWKKLCTFLTAGMLALSVSPAAISAVPEICAAAAENTSTYGELKYTLTSDRAIITSCEKSAVSVTIPEEIEGKPVLQIAENAFYSRTELTDVTIPDTVRALGSRAFYGCSKLNQVSAYHRQRLFHVVCQPVRDHDSGNCPEYREQRVFPNALAGGAPGGRSAGAGQPYCDRR